jgi:hypothetical protein
MVLRLEPAVIGAAEFIEWPEFDHEMFLVEVALVMR